MCTRRFMSLALSIYFGIFAIADAVTKNVKWVLIDLALAGLCFAVFLLFTLRRR